MLIRAIVSNFKSFDGSTELAMVSSSKIRRKEGHIRKVHSAKVLKYAVVYGANAAGKSNLVDFFGFFQRVLTDGLTIADANLFCRNEESNRERPSSFELQFSINDRVFAYGFTALLSEQQIIDEWLYDISGIKPITLLVRDTSHGDSIDTDLNLPEQERTRFDTYAGDFAGEQQLLFLGELNRSKRYVSGSPFQVFVNTYEWLTTKVVTVSPTKPPRDAQYLLTDEGVKRAGELLGYFDTGVSGIAPAEMSLESFADTVGKAYLDQIRQDADEKLRGTITGKIRGCLQTSDGLYFFDVDRSGISNVTMLRLRHRGVTSLFDFKEESDGTKRLFDLMNILLSEEDDILYVIDELERSLHPMLVRRYLELFMERNAKGSSQLVFTTHESSIMSQDIFRRDEIWFVDRGEKGNSRLYSLDRFKDRFDKDIAKAYLDGRYGAIPVFSDSE